MNNTSDTLQVADAEVSTSEAVKATDRTKAILEAATEGTTEGSTEGVTDPVSKETKKQEAASKLKVDEKGNVVDEKGNTVKPDENGNITVKTSDGETVTVTKEDVQEATKGSSSSGNKVVTPTEKATQKVAEKATQKVTEKATERATQKATEKATERPVDKVQVTEPQKTWHEAEYKYVNHPAETKQEWVVDKEAYTYEEPIYETREVMVCQCGQIFFDTNGEYESHILDVFDNYGIGHSYSVEDREVQVGTKTVSVPAEGHYETVVVKEAWVEKILVRPAGWY